MKPSTSQQMPEPKVPLRILADMVHIAHGLIVELNRESAERKRIVTLIREYEAASIIDSTAAYRRLMEAAGVWKPERGMI